VTALPEGEPRPPTVTALPEGEPRPPTVTALPEGEPRPSQSPAVTALPEGEPRQMNPQKPPEDREAFVGKEESEEAAGRKKAPGPVIFISARAKTRRKSRIWGLPGRTGKILPGRIGIRDPS